MCKHILKRQSKNYSFNWPLHIFQFLLVPSVLYGVIYLFSLINIHYNPFDDGNATITNSINISNSTVNLWKGLDFNISTCIVLLYFIFYLFINVITSFVFLFEGLSICYLVNIVKYYYNTPFSHYSTFNPSDVLLVISGASLFAIVLIFGIFKYYKKTNGEQYKIDRFYFPLSLLFIPFFTIFNTFKWVCKCYRNIGNNYYYDMDDIDMDDVTVNVE